ncbi:hypothetical protein ACFPES_22935 [Paenibacillus sp. GCM10023248]|uniref:hypothetical protein n=1 Tax=Bacillales TaxID=1385 RepID=UPI0023781E4C|nr:MULTISPECIES: hypothetical protein [Bacillales]MDD9269914.1 hypothetical protein [Paenibacillus sp. MAHUQ-63]MDR6883134.1 hypothetical protein [Bacillus sp. 3255]
MIDVIAEQKNVFSLSQLLNVEPGILLRLCQYIESRGHQFTKSAEGAFEFNDNDIAVILALY